MAVKQNLCWQTPAQDKKRKDKIYMVGYQLIVPSSENSDFYGSIGCLLNSFQQSQTKEFNIVEGELDENKLQEENENGNS